MEEQNTSGFCRKCYHQVTTNVSRCPNCKSPKLVLHQELFDLAIAHIDCDAFYAAVEKRDNPDLADKPVIIGGEKRGVVSTACYIARISGVRSAMPMFKAKKLCPDAVIIRGNMKNYSKVGAEIRQMMQELTPMVEPISIDEAFLDLTGTQRLLKNPPALSLARLSDRIFKEIGITVSVGLSHNKYLAKVASDFDKPRGFSVIGKAETLDFLADKPVSMIWGVGKAMQNALAHHGITTIGQLRRFEKSELLRNFGVMGTRLFHLSRGEDHRKITPSSGTKSISTETTFNSDIASHEQLEKELWRLSEKVSERAKKKSLAGFTITVKLKTADFKSRTRATSLLDPTFMAERIFSAGKPLLKKEADGTPFRLLGIGISQLEPMSINHLTDSLDQTDQMATKTELAMDKLREKFGKDAIGKGRGFKPPKSRA